MFRLRDQARETLSDVTDASKKVITTSEMATVALVAVAALAGLALLVGLVALARTGPGPNGYDGAGGGMQ